MLKLLSSRPLSLFLFFTLCLLLAISTFFSELKSYTVPLQVTLLTVLSLNITACTIYNWKRFPLHVILIHAGCVITLSGGLVSSSGYVATVNIYQGDSTRKVFRWDINKDIDLPFDLALKKIHFDYFPSPLKIGVLKNKGKYKLIESRTGQTFTVDEHLVTITSFNPSTLSVLLEVTPPNQKPYTFDTAKSDAALPSTDPFSFKLVAFQKPFLKRSWAELEIRTPNAPLFSSTTEVNNPMKWKGYKFFLTAADTDSSGNYYAGIQITKDPGTPITFSGFAFICAGLIPLLRKRK